jgi:ATP-dependent helicase/DNAse subunit B
MTLITGPPGSGKTSVVMGEVRRRLAAGARDFRLLVPTSTMAEHLGNQLAREGFVFPPELVSTLTRFLAGYSKDLRPAPPAALLLIVEQALARRAPPAFAKVAGFPGFQRYLARLIDEFATAGCDAGRLSGLGIRAPAVSAFVEVYRTVQADLRERGWLLRGELLSRLAPLIEAGPVPEAIYFDGFLSLTDPELEVVRALAARARVTLTLPVWSGAEPAREALLKAGFEEQTLAARLRAEPTRVVVEARSLAGECDEVARRILAQHDSGTLWREMGVILRGPGPYVPALGLSFERFGVPARFYFAEPAAGHQAIRFLTGIVEAMLGGWDHQALVAPLTMPLSGLGGTAEGDRFEFELRQGLPAHGLEALPAFPLRDALKRLDAWSSQRATPAEWAARVTSLRSLVAPPPPAEPFTHDAALVTRSVAAALDAFEAAAEEASEWMDDAGAVPFAEYWRSVRAALETAELRVRDRRRDVVHVIDAYEARQWELPVAFVCGLLEKEFPRYHSEDPIFDDDARRRLAGAGVRLPTSDQRQREEGFLFEIATSRATVLEVLSYPRYNPKGEENLRSFFLEPDVPVEAARPARPASRNPARVVAPAPIFDDELLAYTAARHAKLAPTSIESFLQCPFQFFARKTLALETAPADPQNRLDIPLQGQILHDVLAELSRNPRQEPLSLLARRFEVFCERERVPQGYRREAVRLELERNLAMFLDRAVLPEGWRTEVEQWFDLDLGDVRIGGRIDRIDVDPATGRAVVVDYKYSSPQTVRDTVKAHELGRLVQGGLYLLAAEKCFGLNPAAMVYCGIRSETSVQGWRRDVPELPDTVTNCVAEVFREVIDQAVARSREAAARIRAGEIRAAPADADKCRYCDFLDICRVESAPAVVTAAEGAE